MTTGEFADIVQKMREGGRWKYGAKIHIPNNLAF